MMASPQEVLSSFWLELQRDAAKMNAFVNHPEIYPHVKGVHSGPIDLTKSLASGNNHALAGVHGGVVFNKLMPGVYEMHTAVLPEGRGQWMVEGARQAFFMMFTQTDCVEILTHCPDGNLAAKAGARAVGMRQDWTADGVYPRDGGMVNSDVYSLKVQDWALMSPFTAPIGEWLHHHLRDEYIRTGRKVEAHSEDRNHDKVAGAAAAIIAGGQPIKGVVLYNRWAVMSRHPPISLLSVDPVILDLGDVRLQVVGDDFRVVTCQ